MSGVVGSYDDYIGFLASQRKSIEALKVAEVSRAQTLTQGLGVASSPPLNRAIKGFNPRYIAKTSKSIVLDYWMGH